MVGINNAVMRMTEKLLLETLKGFHPPTPPVWLMRQAGRYLPEYQEVRKQAGGFLKLCYHPEFAKEVTLQPIRRFGLDAAIIFSDILVIPDVLGQKVAFLEEQGPVLEAFSLEKVEEGFQQFANHSKLQKVYQAIDLTVKALPKTTTMIGFVGSPWTLACYMIEGRSSRELLEIKRLAFQNDTVLQALITLLTEACIIHACAQIEAGCDVIQLFDSWAGILPTAQFQRYVIDPNKAIIERIRKKHPHTPIIAFPRGAGQGYRDFTLQAQPEGISLDSFVNRQWACKEIPHTILLQGNLDPIILCTNPVTIQKETKKMMEDFRERRTIINLGHGVLKYTPPEHVAHFVACVRGKDVP